MHDNGTNQATIATQPNDAVLNFGESYVVAGKVCCHVNKQNKLSDFLIWAGARTHVTTRAIIRRTA